MCSNIHHKLYSFWREPCKLPVYQCKKWRNQNYVGHSAQMSIVFSPLTWLCIPKKTFIIPMRLRFYTFIMRHAKTSSQKGPQIKMFWTNFSKDALVSCVKIVSSVFSWKCPQLQLQWCVWHGFFESQIEKAWRKRPRSSKAQPQPCFPHNSTNTTKEHLSFFN